jgi:hypothetical protein
VLDPARLIDRPGLGEAMRDAGFTLSSRWDRGLEEVLRRRLEAKDAGDVYRLFDVIADD